MLVVAPIVVKDPTFQADVETLRVAYPDVDRVIDRFVQVLQIYGGKFAHKPIRPGLQLFAHNLDYPPFKSGGKRAFIVTYHAAPYVGSGGGASRKFTLLTITARRPN